MSVQDEWLAAHTAHNLASFSEMLDYYLCDCAELGAEETKRLILQAFDNRDWRILHREAMANSQGERP